MDETPSLPDPIHTDRELYPVRLYSVRELIPIVELFASRFAAKCRRRGLPIAREDAVGAAYVALCETAREQGLDPNEDETVRALDGDGVLKAAARAVIAEKKLVRRELTEAPPYYLSPDYELDRDPITAEVPNPERVADYSPDLYPSHVLSQKWKDFFAIWLGQQPGLKPIDFYHAWRLAHGPLATYDPRRAWATWQAARVRVADYLIRIGLAKPESRVEAQPCPKPRFLRTRLLDADYGFPWPVLGGTVKQWNAPPEPDAVRDLERRQQLIYAKRLRKRRRLEAELELERIRERRRLIKRRQRARRKAERERDANATRPSPDHGPGPGPSPDGVGT